MFGRTTWKKINGEDSIHASYRATELKGRQEQHTSHLDKVDINELKRRGVGCVCSYFSTNNTNRIFSFLERANPLRASLVVKNSNSWAFKRKKTQQQQAPHTAAFALSWNPLKPD